MPSPITLPLSSLLSLLLAESDSTSAAASHWIRRPGRPVSDLPSRIIPPDLAALIKLADPESLHSHIQTVQTSSFSYSVLWLAHDWHESNERRYQLRLASAKVSFEHFSNLAHRDAIDQRFVDIAKRFVDYFRFPLPEMLKTVHKYWHDSEENEARFKEALAYPESVVGVSLYIPPPQAPKPYEQPQAQVETLHFPAPGSEGTQSQAGPTPAQHQEDSLHPQHQA